MTNLLVTKPFVKEKHQQLKQPTVKVPIFLKECNNPKKI
jgi:hypothetical protein